MTKTEKIVEWLKARGREEIIPSKSKKYRQFTGRGPNSYYWVGKNGALRSGRTVRESFSIGYIVLWNIDNWNIDKRKGKK